MMLTPDHELRAALRTVPDQTELTQRTPIVGIALATAGHGLRPASSASWARWLRASRRICSCRMRSRHFLLQNRCQSRWTGNGRPHFGSAQVRTTGSAGGWRRVMGDPRAWSKPDGQRIFAARHARNPSRFKPMVIASGDPRTCPRRKIAPRAVSTAGFAAGSGSEDRQRSGPVSRCGQFIPIGQHLLVLSPPVLTPSGHSKHSLDLPIGLSHRPRDGSVVSFVHCMNGPRRRVTWQATSNDENS
jgi:hypothetical protein